MSSRIVWFLVGVVLIGGAITLYVRSSLPQTPLAVRNLVTVLGQQLAPDPETVEAALHQAGVMRHADIPYAAVPGIDPARQRLDLYSPAGQRDATPRRIILYIHGGTWVAGSKQQALFKPALLVPAGFLFAAANYPLMPESSLPELAYGVARAVRWLRDHGAEYGGDARRIILMGHSSGAHLVSVVGTNEQFLDSVGLQLTDLEAVVSLDVSLYDLPRFVPAHSGRFQNIVFAGSEPSWEAMSPALHVEPGKPIPRFLAVFADSRPAAKQQLILDFVAQLRAAGTSAATYQASGKSHATLDYDIGRPDEAINEVILEFLNKPPG